MVSTWRTKLERGKVKEKRILGHFFWCPMVELILWSVGCFTLDDDWHTRTWLRLTLKGPKWNQLKYPTSTKRFKWLKEANKQKKRAAWTFFIRRQNSSRTQAKHRVCFYRGQFVPWKLNEQATHTHTHKEIASTKWSWLVSGQPKPVSRLVILSLLVPSLCTPHTRKTIWE